MDKKTRGKKYKYTKTEQEALDVMRQNASEMAKTGDKLDESFSCSENAVDNSEKLLEKYSLSSKFLPAEHSTHLKLYQKLPKARGEFDEGEWAALVEKAHLEIGVCQ